VLEHEFAPIGIADEGAITADGKIAERSLGTDFAGYLTQRELFSRIQREYAKNARRKRVQNSWKTRANNPPNRDECAANKKGRAPFRLRR
jgi:hypothetical protein